MDAYISNYRGSVIQASISIDFSHLILSLGRTRFDRLYLIGISSTHLYLEALKAAIAEAKRGNDVARYEQAVDTLAEAAPEDPGAVPDTVWIERTKKMVKIETDKMELELKGYKNNLIKESIRVRNLPFNNDS